MNDWDEWTNEPDDEVMVDRVAFFNEMSYEERMIRRDQMRASGYSGKELPPLFPTRHFIISRNNRYFEMEWDALREKKRRFREMSQREFESIPKDTSINLAGLEEISPGIYLK